MGSTYQPRWPIAFALTVPRAILGVALGCVVGLLVGRLLGGDPPPPFGFWLALGLVLVATTTGVALSQQRPSTLTETPEGLVLTRNGCRITVLWRDFDQVRQRRDGFVQLEELVFREGDVRPVDPGAPFINLRVRQYRRRGLDRRIRPELFVRDWRSSPLGAACPAR